MEQRILILGGTTEARQLCEQLADRPGLRVTLSLAGRTERIPPQRVPVRIGGFGGAQGLADHLRAERVDALIDATHPYAEIISASALEAAACAGVPFVALRRAPWQRAPGDRWTAVEKLDDAAAALGSEPRRVFLALGRKEVRAFERAPQHFYLVRSVDPVDPPLAVPRAVYVLERGPFHEAADRALLQEHAIEIVVCRNSGGDAAYAKIAAARSLGLPVLLLERPRSAQAPRATAAPCVESVAGALAWIAQLEPR